MEREYFTPDISELFQGYECEWFGQINLAKFKSESWMPVKIHSSWNEPGRDMPFNRAYKEIKAGRIRTPYLTMEDIYAEGYQRTSHKMKAFNHIPEPAGMMDGGEYEYELFFMENHHSLRIKETYKGGWGGQHTESVIYDGPCKSINEFRKLESWFKMKIWH